MTRNLASGLIGSYTLFLLGPSAQPPPHPTLVERAFPPCTFPEPALTHRVATALRGALGADKVLTLTPMMGGEDFGAYGLEGHQIPTAST